MRFLILPFLAVPLLAHADPARAPDAGQMHTDDCAKARQAGKPCVLDMKGEEIGGTGTAPDSYLVEVMQTAKHGSLVHIRRDFIIEILKTAEDL